MLVRCEIINFCVTFNSSIIKIFKITLLFVFSSNLIFPQKLSEIMFYPSDRNNEFIEIYNDKEYPINFIGWKVKYHTSNIDSIVTPDTTKVLNPGVKIRCPIHR